jgi:hypothetical protein
VQEQSGQTREEQGKVSINLILIICNNTNYVKTIKKRLQFLAKRN